MILDRAIVASRISFLENKVTLRRHGAPLLYAYDAFSFLRRLKGLHDLPPLRPTDALIIRPCKAIHTVGLKKPIDVIFMDRKGIILKLETVRPKRFLMCLRGRVAVEMAHGTADRIGLRVGQQFTPSEGKW